MYKLQLKQCRKENSLSARIFTFFFSVVDMGKIKGKWCTLLTETVPRTEI